jgi:hypothetical protein
VTTRRRETGLTLIEVLGSLAIGALLFAALSGVALQSTRALGLATGTATLQEDAAFALDRIVDAVRSSRRLLIPMPERGSTAYSESQRNVLAMTLDPTLDRDGNGFADADNDRDGRVDEDSDEDATNDLKPGIIGIDDDGDGAVDEDDSRDDDEDHGDNEDKVDGVDNDADGLVDEDTKHDMNDDGKPGLADVDDDGDGAVDEGNREDDDEDGSRGEDWLDARLFRVVGTTLVERLPDLNAATGAIFTERTIATGVGAFQVRYWPALGADSPPTLQITLTLTNGGATATVDTRVRLGTLP